jgi:hypothetical protein
MSREKKELLIYMSREKKELLIYMSREKKEDSMDDSMSI